MPNPTLVAVDTNVVLLLAAEDEGTTDACQTILNRIKPVHFLVPPTVVQELVFKARTTGQGLERHTAQTALLGFRARWHFQPAVLNSVQQAIAHQAARCLRDQALLPYEEWHDAVVLAEAAVLGCALLLTHDSHLRDIDFQRLSLLLRELDLSAPVIATPAEVIKKFYR
jgi:predicted nucleic acid-binding protein